MLKSAIGSWGWKRKCVLALGFLVSTGAWALPTLTVVPYGTDGFGTLDGTIGWTIGDPGPDAAPDAVPPGPNRITVDGTPWTKLLQVPAGGLSSADEEQTLTEYLKLANGTNLNSWTKSIGGPAGWKWVVGGDSDFPGATDPTIEIEVFADGGSIDSTPAGSFTLVSDTLLKFNFDLALPVDFWSFGDAVVFITITKQLGCALPGEESCLGQITVVDSGAVPEPGTLLLLAGGLAGLGGLGLRRRRYS